VTARLLAAVLLLFAAGCTAPETSALVSGPGSLPNAHRVAEVPFFPQEELYCGPAALATALTWSGLPTTQEAVAPQVYAPGREGSLASDLVTAARRQGRLAVLVEDLRALLGEIAADHPVIVFQNLALDWVPRWHFAVAYGYDLEARTLFLRSGTVESLEMSLDAFERTWARADRWALVVLPPDRLPATADQTAVLRAAAGLEQAGRPAEAAEAYAAIAERWPQNVTARIGEGNARFALAQYAPAEAAFRAALALEETSAPAWNNLAHALARQGRRDEAVAAAERALALGGGDSATYAATLQEVSQAR